jgi:hypothetical protein
LRWQKRAVPSKQADVFNGQVVFQMATKETIANYTNDIPRIFEWIVIACSKQMGDVKGVVISINAITIYTLLPFATITGFSIFGYLVSIVYKSDFCFRPMNSGRIKVLL